MAGVRLAATASGELVYGRVTKLVPFGSFVQVGDGIEGLVHISEMSAHHVDLPEQVVTPGEELWVKIIDIDLQRRRISLSIKQAAEGGVVAQEYQEHFGEHAFDDEGNYIGPTEVDPATEAAWAEYYEELEGGGTPTEPGSAEPGAEATADGAGQAPRVRSKRLYQPPKLRPKKRLLPSRSKLQPATPSSTKRAQKPKAEKRRFTRSYSKLHVRNGRLRAVVSRPTNH